jgi:predicted O-methyltransferase YrrM
VRIKAPSPAHDEKSGFAAIRDSIVSVTDAGPAREDLIAKLDDFEKAQHSNAENFRLKHRALADAALAHGLSPVSIGIAASDHEMALSKISTEYAQALNRIVRETKPQVALEVGMASGVSTEAILSALPPGGRLISIDPLQSTYFGNAGRARAQRFAAQHTLIEDWDYLAFPRLIAEGVSVSMAYIDGHHSFDYVLLDFFFVDKLLSVGGVVGFNDCQMPSISKAISFLMKFRRYQEINVGLKPVYTGRWALLRRAFRYPPEQDRYFRKIEKWEPAWNFHEDF